MTIAYMNNTSADVSGVHAAIMAAITNGGEFSEDFADIFTLAKAPVGSAVEYVLDFA